MTNIETPLPAMAAALALGAGIVPSSPTSPVVGNVRLSVQGGAALLTFTDMEMWLSTSVPVEADAITMTTLPAGLLSRAALAMEGPTLNLQVNGQRAIAKAGKARFNLPLLSADAFPMPTIDVDGSQKIVINAGSCAKALNAVVYSAGDGILHPETAHFALADGGVEIGSFDGTRAAADTIENSGDEPDHFAVSIKAAKALAKICEASPREDLEISIGERFAEFGCGPWMLRTTLADGRFPHLARAVSTFEDGAICQFAVKELDRALGRLQLLADKHSGGVKLELSGDRLALSLVNQKIGDASEEVAVAYDGEPLTAGFRLNFIRDALRGVASAQAELCIDSGGRGLVRPLDRTASTAIHFFGPYQI